MKTNADRTNAYATVPLNPVLEAARLKKESPTFARAWDAQAEEFEALDALLGARKRAGLTQAQVAEAMGVKQSSLARVEASLSSRSHAPHWQHYANMRRRWVAGWNLGWFLRRHPRQRLRIAWRSNRSYAFKRLKSLAA